MRAVLCFALALVLVSFQAAILHHLGGGWIPVALALPVVVYLGLNAGNLEGAFGAAGVGYLLDLMAGGQKGLLTALAVALFLFSRLAVAALSIHGRGGFAVLCGIGTFLFGGCALLLARAISPIETAPGARLLGRVVLESVTTGLAAPLIFSLLRRIDGLFSRDEPGLLP